MPKLRESRFFDTLVRRYARAPSIAMCRVAELELLSAVPLKGPVLDHCCGDGWIAATAFPDRRLDAGVDISTAQVKRARGRGNYADLRVCDAGVALPFADGAFRTVFNNSGIEHIPDIATAVREIARVLAPGGRYWQCVLNARYFEWWTSGADAARSYREFQPFPHALDEAAWTDLLRAGGFSEVRFTDYFPRAETELLGRLDYDWSSLYFRKRFPLRVVAEHLSPSPLVAARWRRRLADLEWAAPPGAGGGFLIEAVKPGA